VESCSATAVDSEGGYGGFLGMGLTGECAVG
jgi:hypothetical protein